MTATRERTDGPGEEITPEAAAVPSASRGGHGRLRRVLTAAGRQPGIALSAAVVVLVLIAAIAPRLFTDVDPTALSTGSELEGPSAAHPLGTDELGRDAFARLVNGTLLSVLGPLLAVLVALLIGTVVGLLSGTVGGWVDSLLMRAVDVMMALPAFLLSLVIILLLGFSTTNAALAVGIASSTTFARLIRAEVLRIRESQFIEAARISGVAPLWIVLRHLVPNAAPPVLALATLNFGTALIAISSLSFLGFGTQPPSSEWGLLLSSARDYMSIAWWLVLSPAVAIIATVLSVNYIGRWLRARRSGASL